MSSSNLLPFLSSFCHRISVAGFLFYFKWPLTKLNCQCLYHYKHAPGRSVYMIRFYLSPDTYPVLQRIYRRDCQSLISSLVLLCCFCQSVWHRRNCRTTCFGAGCLFACTNQPRHMRLLAGILTNAIYSLLTI